MTSPTNWSDWDPAKDPIPRELVVTGNRDHQIDTFRRVLADQGRRAATAGDGCHCDESPHLNRVHDSAGEDAPLLAAAIADVLALAEEAEGEGEGASPEVDAFIAEMRDQLEYRLYPLAEFVLQGAVGRPGPDIDAAVALLTGLVEVTE